LTIFSSVAASIWRRRAFTISRIASLDAVIGERSRPIGPPSGQGGHILRFQLARFFIQLMR
jgi:hypothetical protein